MLRISQRLTAGMFSLAACLFATAGTASAQTPPADQIGLRVNFLTGDVRLIGNAGDPAELAGYTISSPNSSLDSFQWDSLSDQGAPDFVEFVQSDAAVDEQSFGATVSINATGRSLGLLFRPGGTQDLAFAYDEQDAGGVITPLAGGVTYVPEPATASLLVAGACALRRRRQSR